MFEKDAQLIEEFISAFPEGCTAAQAVEWWKGRKVITHHSYPNGSAYTVYGVGFVRYGVQHPRLRRVAVGKGADFGIHFCSRDQVWIVE
jgi:hypothetical protein